MSIVVIDYDQLSSIAKNADKAANRMNDYINDLTKKISNKYSSLEGGQSSKTSNSQYYVNQKIKKLNEKKAAYTAFAADLRKLSTKAQEIDKQVAKSINASKDEFVDKHDYIETNWWTDLKEWFIDMKNKCPLFNAICTLIQGSIDNISYLFRELKHWYKCGGGKEIIGVYLAFAGAICAAALAVIACVPPICGIVAICAAIGAVIAAANAIVNVVTSVKAKQAKDNGDPAWAKIYGDQDTAQDVLRQTNFKDGFLNKLSIHAAMGIDVVQTLCDAVAIGDGIKNVGKHLKEIKRYASRSQTRNFGQVLVSYLKNEKNYRGLKLGDYIRNRVKAPSELSNIKKAFSRTNAVISFIDKLNNGDTSLKDIAKNGGKLWTKLTDLKFPSLLYKGYDFFKKDINGGIVKDIAGFKGLAGPRIATSTGGR